jgi:large repetitive protein
MPRSWGIRLIAFGSATTVANVTKATIANNVVLNFPSGSGIQAQGGNANAAGTAGIFGTAGSATDVIAITGNRVSGASPAVLMGAQAILGVVNGKGQGNFDISTNGTVANPIGNTIGTTLALSSFGSANVTATINNNVIVSNNKFASQGIGAGTGITFAASEAPTLAMTISGNNISQTDGNGILVVARDATGTVRAKIQNNTVAAPLTGNRNGIRIDSGNGASANESVCLNISSNISAGTGLTPEGIGIRKQGAIAGVNNMAFHGLATSPATAAQALAYIASQNPGSASGAFLVSGDNFNSPTCNLP